MRYRFYRVHKYVCFELANFDSTCAKTDFSDSKACLALIEKFTSLTQMLKHHGEYEDAHIHELLRRKSSNLQLNIEKEHQHHEQEFITLNNQLQVILSAQDPAEKIMRGYEFYLSYRLFYGEMLKHLYDEEKVLLPELQALYSDDELAALQSKTYQKMTPEQILGMLNVLFPHASPEDMSFFINEINVAVPEKIEVIWEELSPKYKESINRFLIKS